MNRHPIDHGKAASEVNPNANFHSLLGSSEPETAGAEYLEYRRAWHENPKGFVLRDFPLHLDIETTNRCNLMCTFCDKQPFLGPEDFGMLDMDLFRKIIDEAAGHQLWGLKLSYRGEPLLHKQIVEMVAYAKQKGVLDIYFNTNGMLLSAKKSRELIEAGLDRISISIEGVDAAAYEQARVGAKFDIVRRNIESLKEQRDLLGVSHPKIRIQTVLFPGDDLEAYRDFWGPFADEIAAVDYKEEAERTEGLVRNWGCPQLWQRMTVEWDGTIFACNNDDEQRRLSPGNARDMSIHEAWHHPMVRGVRDLHQAGRSHEVPDCNGCPWRTTQIQKLMEADGE